VNVLGFSPDIFPIKFLGFLGPEVLCLYVVFAELCSEVDVAIFFVIDRH
jgi:hypothetical protein